MLTGALSARQHKCPLHLLISPRILSLQEHTYPYLLVSPTPCGGRRATAGADGSDAATGDQPRVPAVGVGAAEVGVLDGSRPAGGQAASDEDKRRAVGTGATSRPFFIFPKISVLAGDVTSR